MGGGRTAFWNLFVGGIAAASIAALLATMAGAQERNVAPQPGAAAAEPAAASAAAEPAAEPQPRRPRGERAARSRPDNHRARAGAKPSDQEVRLQERAQEGASLSILAGPLDATATAAVYDLAAVLDDGDRLRILPIIGKGGAQTLRDLKFMKEVDLGVIGTDVLARLRRSGELGKIAGDLVYVTKLFNEEVHVLARADSGITDLRQLAERRVAVGPVGADASARDLFQRLGIKPVAVNLTTADAIEMLKSGDIAAAVVIDGKPASSIRTLPPGFRLIPVPYRAALQEDFLPGELAAADYPALIGEGGAVETVAVGAVLVAVQAPRWSERYKRIDKFVQALFPRIADFQRAPRHPKWKDTNIAAAVPGVPRFAPAQDWLKRNAEAAATQARDLERLWGAAQTTGRGAPSEDDRDRLFQEFLRWNQGRERR